MFFLERFMKDIKSLFEGKIKGILVFGKDIEKKYLSDFIGARVGHADVYARVKDEDDVQIILKIAYANRLNVVVRGAGTNLAGSTIPDGGVVLDVSDMNQILELDDETLTVTVQPGVILRDLIEYVEKEVTSTHQILLKKGLQLAVTSQLTQVA